MLLKAALNGARTRAEAPALPCSPAELAAEAAASVAAGAGAIHVHVRDAAAAESLAPPDVAAALEAVRAACPGTPVGISSGAWILPSPSDRLAAVRGWTVRPDFVSVNLHEDGAVEVAEALLERGIAVEAGLQDDDAARSFVAWRRAHRCLRVLLEPAERAAEEALAVVARTEAVLDATPAVAALPRLLHGFDATAWPLVAAAARRGLDSRVGLEDVLVLPDGRRAGGNAELVAAARAIAERTRG